MSTNHPDPKQTVLVCGSLHFDVVVSAPSLPSIDETVTGSNVDYICGGKGGNQAVAAARNGASTTFMGCIGDDEFGDQLASNLQKNDVDCSRLQKTTGASGMSVAIVDANGDYGAVIVSAANLEIDSNAIELPESTGLLLLQNEIPDSQNIALAKQARALEIPVMLNAAPYRALSSHFEKLIDILILNRVEATAYFDTQLATVIDVEAALTTTRSSIDTLIVTLGKDGLVYCDENRQATIRSAFSVPVSSSHGAGDMFCGALASRLVAGSNLDEALTYAMAAAAWHVSSNQTERSSFDADAINRLITG